MNIVIRNVLLEGLLLLAVPLAAQVPQELIDKAKASGMSETQIQQEIAKRMGQSDTDQATKRASEAVVTDRTVTTTPGKEELSIEEQRQINQPENDLKETVFGREIFSNKNLSFEPDLNIPTPKNYILSAGDELQSETESFFRRGNSRSEPRPCLSWRVDCRSCREPHPPGTGTDHVYPVRKYGRSQYIRIGQPEPDP